MSRENKLLIFEGLVFSTNEEVFIDLGGAMDFAFLNFIKTFDSVPNQILTENLLKYELDDECGVDQKQLDAEGSSQWHKV